MLQVGHNNFLLAKLQLPVKLPSVCIWNCLPNFLLNDVTHVAFILCQFDPAKLRKLRPSFKENGGTVTAGNASSIRSIPNHGQKIRSRNPRFLLLKFTYKIILNLPMACLFISYSCCNHLCVLACSSYNHVRNLLLCNMKLLRICNHFCSLVFLRRN